MNETRVKLYLDWESQPSRAVAAFLLMNDIPHEIQQIKLFKGEARTKHYIEEVNSAS